MKEQAKIINFDTRDIDFEDIICVLNPTQIADLTQILIMTLSSRRLGVALAFANLTIMELADKSGLSGKSSDGKDTTFRRWLNHGYKLPLGAAFRIAKVFGVSIELLFESPEWQGIK